VVFRSDCGCWRRITDYRGPDSCATTLGDAIYGADAVPSEDPTFKLVRYSPPGDEWTELEDPPVRFGYEPFVGSTGTEVLVWNPKTPKDGARGAIYTP
jgi:hypothetical protein